MTYWGRRAKKRKESSSQEANLNASTFVFCSGEGGKEETAALYEEATMPLEQLLERYGYGANKPYTHLQKDPKFQSPVIRAKTENENANTEASASTKGACGDEVAVNLDSQLVNGHSENENNANLEKERADQKTEQSAQETEVDSTTKETVAQKDKSPTEASNSEAEARDSTNASASTTSGTNGTDEKPSSSTPEPATAGSSSAPEGACSSSGSTAAEAEPGPGPSSSDAGPSCSGAGPSTSRADDVRIVCFLLPCLMREQGKIRQSPKKEHFDQYLSLKTADTRRPLAAVAVAANGVACARYPPFSHKVFAGSPLLTLFVHNRQLSQESSSLLFRLETDFGSKSQKKRSRFTGSIGCGLGFPGTSEFY